MVHIRKPKQSVTKSYSKFPALVGQASACQHPLPPPFAKSSFNYGERALGNLQAFQALRLHPFDAADVIARAQRAAGDAADGVDQHVVVLRGAFGDSDMKTLFLTARGLVLRARADDQ